MLKINKFANLDMDNKLVGLITLFFIVFVMFVGIVFFNQPLSRLTRAKEDKKASATKSKIIGCPFMVKADAKASCELNVFVAADDDTPLSNRTVTINADGGQVKEPLTQTSATNGKVTFHIISNIPQKISVQFTVDNSIKISQPVTVEFQ